MAKKKTVRKGRGKKSNKINLSSIISSLKQLGISATMAVVMIAMAMVAYNCFFDKSVVSDKEGKTVVENKKTTEEKTKTTVEKVKSSAKKSEKKNDASAKKSSSKTLKVAAGVEIPDMKVKRPEQVIKHEGYTVSYNSDYKIANWVAYELTPEEATSTKTERSNKFTPDPQVTSVSALNDDYLKTGYDRGHLAPAGDMKWSLKAMQESFYFSNITPQKPGLNRGVWKDLEERIRLWAADYGSMYIATGPVIESDLRRLGKNRVGIPKRFYKVIMYVKDGSYTGVGFLFENQDYRKKNVTIKDFAVPIDSVESVTGIDFFPSVPAKEQERMESSVRWNDWYF